MLICDTHADTLFRAATAPDDPARDVTLEKLRRGGVSMQTLAMFVGDSPTLNDIRNAFQQMYAALARFKAQGWKQILSPAQAQEGETAFLLSVEGCDLLRDGMSQLDAWDKMGVRMLALTWNYPNCVGTPACVNDDDPLTPFGREAVQEMARRHLAVDVSHLNRGGFFDLLEMRLHPLASHSCAAALCPHPRNLTDDQLRALFQAGGYVGVNFYPYFLSADGTADLDTVCRHVEHMLHMGGEGKIGFGSDFDGIGCKPRGLDGPQDLPALVTRLTAAFGEKTARGIAGQNLVAYFNTL